MKQRRTSTYTTLLTRIGVSLITLSFAASAFAPIAEAEIQAGGVLRTLGGGGTAKVPIFDSDSEALRRKEVGVSINTGLPGIPGLSGIPGTKTSLDSIAWGLADFFIHKIADETVRWIQSGGKNGKPLFVTNWKEFLLDAADEAGGQFLDELGFADICAPFKPHIQILLGGGRKAYHDRARCTITDIIDNAEDFYEDFSNGGWTSWFYLTQRPENNFYGSYYLALEEKYLRESGALETAQNEAIASDGFLPWTTEVCEEIQTERYDEDAGEYVPFNTTRCTDEVQTPGKVVQGQLQKVIDSPLDRLHVADEIDEILSAAFDQLMRSLRTSKKGIRDKDKLDEAKQASNREFQNLKQSAITQSGLGDEISNTGVMIDLKTDSFNMITAAIKTLEDLKVCQTGKGLETEETDTRIEAASSTAATLDREIAAYTASYSALIRSQSNLEQSGSVDDFYDDLNATEQILQASVGDIETARQENTTVAEDKSKAEADLQQCKE